MEVLREQGEHVVDCEKVAEEGLREEDVDEVLDECLGERGDAMRCQVKITTCHNLQLRMANYTARDVYVRLLGHGDHISGNGTEASQILRKS
ncbi:hypothetical protein cypCar_00030145 [Cyprinus carpio]|nr:hypothetical protein cypCar_00030145 [Cyprinus carpio]